MKKKDAYVVNFKGQKLYFEWSINGLKAIQKLCFDYKCDLTAKLVKVNEDKELITL